MNNNRYLNILNFPTILIYIYIYFFFNFELNQQSIFLKINYIKLKLKYFDTIHHIHMVHYKIVFFNVQFKIKTKPFYNHYSVYQNIVAYKLMKVYKLIIYNLYVIKNHITILIELLLLGGSNCLPVRKKNIFFILKFEVSL